MSNQFAPIQVFDNQTANGNSLEFYADGLNPNSSNNPMIIINGTFDGALLKLQIEDPDENWLDTDLGNDSWTVAACDFIVRNPYAKYRFNLSGVGTTDISVWVFGCRAA